jgi:hypothetical protein
MGFAVDPRFDATAAPAEAGTDSADRVRASRAMKQSTYS